MRHLATITLIAMLTGCSGAPAPVPAHATPQEAISRVGDVTIRANPVRTMALNETTAQQYGIERRDDTVMLLVSVRQGPDGQDIALPATISATATDLLGKRRDVAMREVRSGDWVDSIGIIEVASPSTLRFDLDIKRENGATSTMQFTRDF